MCQIPKCRALKTELVLLSIASEIFILMSHLLNFSVDTIKMEKRCSSSKPFLLLLEFFSPFPSLLNEDKVSVFLNLFGP